jgi:hypothetical protein
VSAKIGDIVERLPSRIVQLDGGLFLCADGSVWGRLGGSWGNSWLPVSWECVHPPHDPQPATDWQARAIEAGAAGLRRDPDQPAGFVIHPPEAKP